MTTSAIARKGDIAYFDSGPLAAIGRGPRDPHYVGSARLLEAVKESGCRGFTSPLGHMEARRVVAKRTAGSFKCLSGSDAEWEAVNEAVIKADVRFDKIMEDLEGRGLLCIAEIKRPFDLDHLYADMGRRAGRLLTGIKGRPFWYREVGPCDLVHFAIARHLGALAVCTTDAAFADMYGADSEFGHIQVQLALDRPSGPLDIGIA